MMKVTCFGEIMLRLTPQDFHKLEQAKRLSAEFGGSESNVAATLAQLGIPTDYVTRIPNHSFGLSALNTLEQFGVNTRKCIFGGERLGIYFVELGSGRRSSKVIYDRKRSGMYELEPGMIDWSTVLQGQSWLHWSGITPSISRSAADACAEALYYAKQLGLHISCDLNYRSKLWDYGVKPGSVMPGLIEYCDVLVGDMDVMDVYFGLPCQNTQEGFELLVNRFPGLNYIALSERKGLSASHNVYMGLMYHDGQLFQSKPYDLPDMVDRIGSGDAFTAGLITSIIKEDNEQAIIEFATATAVYKHYVPGDINFITLDDVYSLMSGNSGGKVKR